MYNYLTIICINLACYYQSLSGDFVFDDSVAIVKNKDVYEGFNNNTLKVGFMNEKVEWIEIPVTQPLVALLEIIFKNLLTKLIDF